MGTITLLMGIHNHQPQGNFEHVFAQGYEDCYRPLLSAVERHPTIRLSLHYSGPLIEWLERTHPDYFDTLARLVEKKQIEMIGGGFYEPMLSVLPDQDARGQLEQMINFLEGRVNQRPLGMWLAERVWEPDLARLIAAAGYRYTILDDGHFLATGKKRPLFGYFITDKAGLPLCLFPISMELRYAIPFKPVSEAIEILQRLADQAGDAHRVVTYGDDGEKFGMWPGTKKWVWEEGWLDQFFDALTARASQIHTSTFSEVLRQHPAQGRIYLPTASYDEMGEWSLPPEAQLRFHQLAQTIEEQGHKEDWGPFLRGGIWQSFLAKYPESNFMHKRMCYVSKRLARAASTVTEESDREKQKALQRARRELYRGQCNCAYWHGLFGGLYLAKLRSAVHTHLIRADVETAKIIGQPQPVVMEREDIDADLFDEIVLTGRSLAITIAPARGSTLLAIDDRKRAFCISDVLTRRPEAYHAKVLEQAATPQVEQESTAPKSIHDITNLKEEGLADLLLYDPHQRLAFVDQFFPADMPLEHLWQCTAHELGDFKSAPYDILQSAGGTGRIMLGRNGRVDTPAGPVEVQLRKLFHLEERTLGVEYEIVPQQPFHSLFFATELSLTLPAGPHTAAQLSLLTAGETRLSSMTSRSISTDISRIELHDPSHQLTISLLPTPRATVVCFPLDTASQSESGIERTYQGTVFVFLWRCDLETGQCSKPALKLTIQ